MVLMSSGPSGLSEDAVQRRLALAGAGGPRALFANIRVFGIAAFACIGGLLYGYNQGIFSGILVMNNFKAHMGNYATDATLIGWLTSILELGAWFGTLTAGFLAEILSRKKAIILETAIFILGVIIQTTAATDSGYNSILAGRFITGIGVGSLSMIVPMYVAECAPAEVRGLLVGLQQVAIEVGIMISFWIDYGTNYIGGTGDTQSEAAWLVPLSLQLAPALILIVGMTFMPYSPRWLVHHNREDEARRVLATLRGHSVESELVHIEFLEIKAQSMFEKRTIARDFPALSHPSAWNTIKLQFVAIAALFKSKPMFRRVIVATVTMFFQQWTGINAILYYAPQIFAKLGLGSNTTNLLATGVVGIVMLIATLPAVLYIDKVGRKPILAGGAFVMAFCHLLVAILFAKNATQWDTQQAAGWAAVVFVWVFAMAFGASWGPAAWILVAEVWPLSSRPYGIALGASSNWMNNFIVGQVTPDMLNTLGYGTFLFFGLLTLLAAFFIIFVTPETKQLSLEEMDTLFGSTGVAAADAELLREINHEVGLNEALGVTRHTGDEKTGNNVLEEKYRHDASESDGEVKA